MATRKKIPLIDVSANLDVTGQVALAGSGSAVITFPATTSTLETTTGSQAKADAKVENSIVDGHTTIAPSGNAVFDALALKSPIDNPTFTTLVTTPSIKITTGASLGKVLTSDADGDATWETASSGMTNPMTTSGDIVYGGASGTPNRLAKGTDGQFLSLDSGVPIWSNPYIFSATDTLRASADTSRNVSSINNYKKYKEIQLPTTSATGTIRVKYQRSWSSGNNIYTQIYKNGVAVAGTEDSGSTTLTLSHDITASPNDLIQLYSKNGGGSGSGTVSSFRVYYDNVVKAAVNSSVITD